MTALVQTSLLHTLVGWLLVFASLTFMGGWARFLLHRAEGFALLPTYNPLLLAVTTIGLSVGTLSLISLWTALLGIGIKWQATAGIAAIVGLLGLLVKDKPSLLHDAPMQPAPPRAFQRIALAAWIVMAIFSGL